MVDKHPNNQKTTDEKLAVVENEVIVVIVMEVYDVVKILAETTSNKNNEVYLNEVENDVLENLDVREVPI